MITPNMVTPVPLKQEAEQQVTKSPGTRLKGYILLVLLPLLAFAPMLTSDFLWTSYDEVERSTFPSLNHWTEAWQPEVIRQDDPLTLTSYFLESSIPLPTATVHRLINLSLHLCSVLWLLKLLESFRLRGAFAAALVFALHPATVQTLFWPGYRNEIVGLIFILSCLFFGTRNRDLKDFLLALVLGVVGSVLHPAALALPGLLALIIIYQHKHLNLCHFNRILPLSCCLLFTFVWTRGNQMSHSNPEDLSLLNHLGQNFYFYLQQILFPFDLKLFHPYFQSQHYNVGALHSSITFLLCVPFYLLALLNLRQRWGRGILLGLSAFLLLLIYGLLHFGRFIDGELAKETHAAYIALPPIITLTICGMASSFHKWKALGKLIWPILLGAVLVTEFGLTLRHSMTLREPDRMWKNLSDQWTESWQPKAALVEAVDAKNSDLLGKSEIIGTLENILSQNPNLHQQRLHLARLYTEANQNTNALREYSILLRETNPEDEILEEAARFMDKAGLSWEANKARERKKQRTQKNNNE